MKYRRRLTTWSFPFLFVSCSSLPSIPVTQMNKTLDVSSVAKLDSKLSETSGLAKHGNYLWTHNDSGNDPVIYALSPKNYSVVKSLRVSNARNDDWEDFAYDDRYLYISDTGNNDGNRETLQIYRLRWSELEAAPNGSSVKAEKMEFSYGDEKGDLAEDADEIDAEAMASVGDELWIFTKEEDRSRLFRLQKNKKMQRAFPMESYPVAGRITAADYNEATGYFALLGYRPSLNGASFIWLVNRKDAKLDWGLAKYYPLSKFSQWEAIAWNGKSRLIVSTEGSALSAEGMARIDLSSPVGRPPASAAD